MSKPEIGNFDVNFGFYGMEGMLEEGAYDSRSEGIGTCLTGAPLLGS